MKYRILKAGEALQERDEVRVCGAWERIVRSLIGLIIRDENQAQLPEGYYRRPESEQ